jgi:rSAM/selenodomain-associated transferase 1
MAKVPLAGTVKTRLGSVLSPEKCAALAAAFLQDTLKKAETVCKNVILAYSPAGQSRLLEDLISSEITLVEQKGANLGERMHNAFEFAFRKNPDSAVVMIGTDSPTFPAENLVRGFEFLEKDSEIVLGRSKDGGFYLIGLRRSVPKLFDRIEWSSPLVFEQLAGNIGGLGIEKLKLVPEHYDVDTPDDLLMMKDEIFGDESLQDLAEKTHRWLLENDPR